MLHCANEENNKVTVSNFTYNNMFVLHIARYLIELYTNSFFRKAITIGLSYEMYLIWQLNITYQYQKKNCSDLASKIKIRHHLLKLREVQTLVYLISGAILFNSFIYHKYTKPESQHVCLAHETLRNVAGDFTKTCLNWITTNWRVTMIIHIVVSAVKQTFIVYIIWRVP